MVSILQIKCQRLMEGGGSDLICVCSVVSVYKFVGVMGLGRCRSHCLESHCLCPPAHSPALKMQFKGYFLQQSLSEFSGIGWGLLPGGNHLFWIPRSSRGADSLASPPTEEARSPAAGPRHLLDPSAPLFFHSPHYTAFVTLPGGCRLLESRGHVFHCSGTKVWLLTGIHKCANSIMNFPESGF